MKIWSIRNVRWIIPAVAFFVISAVAPMGAEAVETQAVGMGPRVAINGHELYAKVEWLEGNTCDIKGPINLNIVVPRKSNFYLRGESAGRFDCNGDGLPETTLMTKTRVVAGLRNRRVRVVASVESPDTQFLVKVSLYKDTELIRMCEGESNTRVRCRGTKF